jgi:hypothetical protein
MKNGKNRTNNGYLGYDISYSTQEGIVGSNKLYNTNLRNNISFDNRANPLGVIGPNYQRPSAWRTLPSVTAGSQIIYGTCAVYNNDSNFLAVQIQGAYNVDWGDGTTGAFGSNVKASKQYTTTTYTGLTSDVYQGYKTLVVTITPQAANNLTNITLCALHSQTGLNQYYSTPWLDIRMSAPFATAISFSDVQPFFNKPPSKKLEQIEFIGTAPLSTVVLGGCANLQKIVAFPSVRAVTNWQSMFHSCFRLQELPATMVETRSNTGTLAYSFYNCLNLRYIPASFSSRNCTSNIGMFQGDANLRTIPNMDTSTSTDTGQMFNGCALLEEVPPLDLRKTTSMYYMFAGCFNLKTIPPFIGSGVAGACCANFQGIFQNCQSLTRVPVLDTANGTDFSYMCYGLATTTIPQYNYTKATTLFGMFRYASVQYVPDFNTTTALTTTAYMFDGCPTIQYCPGITMSKVTNVTSMFNSAVSLQTVPRLDWSSVTDATDVFTNCTSLSYIGITGMCASFAITNAPMGATALNDLYSSLGVVGASGTGAKTLTVTGCYGSGRGDNKGIAHVKGWNVAG